MKRSAPMKRGPGPKRSGKPLKARGATKAKREKKYAAYLKTAKWKAKRAACIAAAGGRCEATLEATLNFDGIERYTTIRCPNRDYLTAHHLTYARWKDELPEDLQCLCRHCHNRLEGLKGRRIA